MTCLYWDSTVLSVEVNMVEELLCGLIIMGYYCCLGILNGYALEEFLGKDSCREAQLPALKDYIPKALLAPVGHLVLIKVERHSLPELIRYS